MDLLLLSSLIFLLVLILLLFLLSMMWPPDSPWSPWWRTNRQVAEAICKVAKITAKDVLHDLGCGDGTVLLTAAQLKGAKGIGVEIDPARVFIARVRALVSGQNKKIKIIRGNLFSTDISEASVVIVYLVPKTLKRLEKKFQQELKPGTRIVSYMYQIDYLPKIAEDKKYKVYVYKQN